MTTTDSNNVTLTLTHIENYCGDGTCNSNSTFNETCSNCATDCGVCPGGGDVGGAGGGGGGGGGATVSTEISPAIPGQLCEIVMSCGNWLPESCKGGTQTRSCLTTYNDCSTTESLFERNCLCTPQWECTIWQPTECPATGYQQRICHDIYNCGKDSDLPLQKTCVPSPGAGKLTLAGRAAFFGKSVFQNVGRSIVDYSPLWIMFILVLIIVLALVLIPLLRKRKKKERSSPSAKASKERIVRVKTPAKTIIREVKVVKEAKPKIDHEALRRKLSLLRESYQRGYLRRETYEKTRENIERILRR